MKKKQMKRGFSKKQFITFAGIFAVIGGLLVWRILAATTAVSVEAEAASLSGKVVKCPASGSDSSASGGSFIMLGNTSCSSTPPPPPTSSCTTRTPQVTATSPGQYKPSGVTTNAGINATNASWSSNSAG